MCSHLCTVGPFLPLAPYMSVTKTESSFYVQAPSWGNRLPALFAGVTQLSNSFTTLTQRINPVSVLPSDDLLA